MIQLLFGFLIVKRHHLAVDIVGADCVLVTGTEPLRIRMGVRFVDFLYDSGLCFASVCGVNSTDGDKRECVAGTEFGFVLEIGKMCAELRQAMQSACSSSSVSPADVSVAAPPSVSDIDILIEEIMTEPGDSTVCSIRSSQVDGVIVGMGWRWEQRTG
jgi:hypothetical protein